MTEPKYAVGDYVLHKEERYRIMRVEPGGNGNPHWYCLENDESAGAISEEYIDGLWEGSVPLDLYPGRDLLCVWCKHWEFDAGWGGTDATPGEAAELRCRKNHYCHVGTDITEESYRRSILTAKACPDFDQRPRYDWETDPTA